MADDPAVAGRALVQSVPIGSTPSSVRRVALMSDGAERATAVFGLYTSDRELLDAARVQGPESCINRVRTAETDDSHAKAVPLVGCHISWLPQRLLDMIAAATLAPRVDDRTELAARALSVARSTALGVLGDHAAAEDVAQEVAIVAIQRARSSRTRASSTRGCTRSPCARRSTRRASASDDRRSRSSRTTTRRTRRSSQALALLAALPPRQRAALTLRYVHDLPDETIAKALGCRPATVRSLLSRGRDALRQTLEIDR